MQLYFIELLYKEELIDKATYYNLKNGQERCVRLLGILRIGNRISVGIIYKVEVIFRLEKVSALYRFKRLI